MPPLPDLRPLIINLLSRYIIQCQLEGGQGLLQQGQRSEVQKWSHLLEVLCASLSAPCQVSYTTLQFVRYVNLLEQIELLSQGDEQAITEVVKLLTNLCNSPELQDPSLKVKLTPLVVDAMCGISSDSASSYSRKVMEFVVDAMDVYAVLPKLSLDEDAFAAPQSSPPSSINRIATTNAVPPAAVAMPTTKNASCSAATTPTTAPQEGKGRKRRKTSTPVKTIKKQVSGAQVEPVLGLENRQLKLANTSPPVLLNNFSIQPESSSVLPQLPELQLGEPSTASPSIAPNPHTATKVTTVSSASLVGEKCGVLITYPPIIPADDEGAGEAPLGVVARTGIFDRGTESGAEINWSSDESATISPIKNKYRRAPTASTGTPKSVTPQGSFIKKGAWSEEESRCLLEGVEKFGEGKWKEIRVEAYSVLKHRTTNQLKDKYRNIKGRMKH